jgi:hypothetical protein
LPGKAILLLQDSEIFLINDGIGEKIEHGAWRKGHGAQSTRSEASPGLQNLRCERSESRFTKSYELAS